MKLQRTRVSVLVAAACAMMASGSVTAATDPEINTAIAKGIDYLVVAQQPGGNWDYGGYDPAATGAAVYALLTQKAQWGIETTKTVGQIQTAVDNGIKYLLNGASSVSVSTRNDGVNICPGGGSCNAVYWNAANNEDSYTTGLIAPAIALYAAGNPGGTSTATAGPLVGKTWAQIAQGITNTWSASQSTANQGALIGGWRYGLNDGYDSDMSTTQWGIISLLYDQTLGATTPGVVTTDLAKWLAFAQNPTTGAGCYQGPSSGICNHSDTGGLLLGLDLVGKPVTDTAVQKALAFLNNNWAVGANGTWYGNFGHPYAMWSVYKGLEVNIGLANDSYITNHGNCGGDRPTDCNWWQDYNEYLVSNQNGNGSWSGYSNWTGNLATAFYLPILGGTRIPQPDVPEPATLALIGFGLAGLAVSRRRNTV
jgi:hypothetical protein